MLKKIFTPAVFFSVFFLVSCVSQNPVLVMLAENDRQQYFIRPEVLSKDGMVISVDFTCLLDGTKIVSDVTVNYTLSSKNHTFSQLEKTQVVLVSAFKTFAVTNSRVLFRDVSANEIRVSGTLSAEKMTDFIMTSDFYALSLSLSDGSKYDFHSKKFSEKLLVFKKSLL